MKENRMAVPSDTPRSRGKRWIGIIQVVISVALLTWLFTKVGLGDVINVLITLNGWYYALAGVLFLAAVAVRALRWYVLLTPLGAQASLLDLFLLYLVGFFWNNLLPTSFGGDVVKAIELRRISHRGAASVMSVIAERVVGLLATSLIALVVIAIRPRLVPLEATLIVVVLCVGIVAATWFLRLDILGWAESHLPFLRPIVSHRWLTSVHQALRTYDLKALGIGLLTSVPFTLLTIVNTYLVGLALGVDLSIGFYAIYTPIVTIVTLAPLAFNGLGVREYTFQILFGLVGVPAEQAIAMALAYNFLRVGAGMLGGVVYLVGGVQRLTRTGVEPQHE